ncbi:MAG: hypothetical protein OEY20_01590 [Gemmatimonadota bacterium]|nr:hypothetical protein [Gemmatimonadota bacterium]MDH4352009.1 hypothetical protein [Gemmatimonadota bacterium]MDH5195925.1 hypothetical protein [Gemmatimonadota bacterium]
MQAGTVGRTERTPLREAARIHKAVDDLTAAQDLKGAIEELRRMDQYLMTLSDDDRREFASHWADPSFGTWLTQTNETLQRDALRTREAGERVDMPDPYGDHRRRPPRQ